MLIDAVPSLGSALRTNFLVYLAISGESYPREMARDLGVPSASVHRLVATLARDGVIATRIDGRERRITLDPRFYAAKELRALLLRIAEAYPQVTATRDAARRRPRRPGKP